MPHYVEAKVANDWLIAVKRSDLTTMQYMFETGLITIDSCCKTDCDEAYCKDRNLVELAMYRGMSKLKVLKFLIEKCKADIPSGFLTHIDNKNILRYLINERAVVPIQKIVSTNPLYFSYANYQRIMTGKDSTLRSFDPWFIAKTLENLVGHNLKIICIQQYDGAPSISYFINNEFNNFGEDVFDRFLQQLKIGSIQGYNFSRILLCTQSEFILKITHRLNKDTNLINGFFRKALPPAEAERPKYRAWFFAPIKMTQEYLSYNDNVNNQHGMS